MTPDLVVGEAYGIDGGGGELVLDVLEPMVPVLPCAQGFADHFAGGGMGAAFDALAQLFAPCLRAG